MPTVLYKNFQLNLTPIINSQNIISDYRLHKLGNGESINAKTCGSNRCKEFCPSIVASDLYIVLLLTDILNSLIKNSQK